MKEIEKNKEKEDNKDNNDGVGRRGRNGGERNGNGSERIYDEKIGEDRNVWEDEKKDKEKMI